MSSAKAKVEIQKAYEPEEDREKNAGEVSDFSDVDSDTLSISVQIAKESHHAVKFRTCSWQKTAALLFSEYICLAILSFPWSFSVLGLVPGIIVTLSVAATCLYTSLVLWRFCLIHPEIRDVCDIGQILFGGSQLACNVFFVLNVYPFLVSVPAQMARSRGTNKNKLKNSCFFKTVYRLVL